MELYEGLLTRRSIRKYTSGSISREKIEEIVKAGMYAPSAVNCQPWHFIIVDDRSVMNKIMEVHPYSKMLAEAQYAIVVLSDTKLEHASGYGVLDCAAATQNILLAAHSFGLGAVWLGLQPREQRKQSVKELFQLPDHILPFSVVSIGYPAENPKASNRFKKERMHYNKW
ncbi:MAG: nitroreductase family protein [Bacteroidales bacterium]